MATGTLEIPVGSGNFVKVNVDAYNNLSQQEKSDFYDYKEDQYKKELQQKQREQLRQNQEDLRKKTTSTVKIRRKVWQLCVTFLLGLP